MDNLSLFNVDEENTLTIPHASTGNMLDVVKLDFLAAETVGWRELFSGFDTLHAITYSSGIGFIYQLLGLFKNAEIIFGCEDVMSYSLQEVMAYQCKLLDRMREKAKKMKLDLLTRIDEGTLHLYVPHKMLSHEKIYLLAAEDGRKRVF